MRFEDSKKRASGTCLVDLRGGRFDRERSTRNRGGGHLLRDIPGGRGLRGRGIDADQIYRVGLVIFQGGGRQGVSVDAVGAERPGKIVEKPILRAGLLDACLLEGRKILIGDSPRSAFGQGVRCRKSPDRAGKLLSSWKISRWWYRRIIPRIGEQGGHFQQRTGCTN